MSNQKYAPQKVIAVDVDGTLHNNGIANQKLIEWCKERKAQGFFLMLWSARGEAYARSFADTFGISGMFDLICSKPGYIVDDQGWGWVKYTKVIRTLWEEIE
jgi:hydroxymethylpyrimidine pyrophosphatase-like HAD family hydrolase